MKRTLVCAAVGGIGAGVIASHMAGAYSVASILATAAMWGLVSGLGICAVME